MEFLVVLALVPGDGAAVLVPDDEPQVGPLPRGDIRGPQIERVTAFGDLQPARRGRRVPALALSAIRIR